ncbi:Proline-, glutamic acid- and leucine-rich protein 1 [Trichoplax sp. H2]|nr:Proline-, glutamic acid- and leucine-rich protein 1 [Trichoplax sp. H2]|eukprot:RDD37440.1 Proline-, glutamic acid- and leucine-rich protein 1 [Trichoplax sp. H2]
MEDNSLPSYLLSMIDKGHDDENIMHWIDSIDSLQVFKRSDNDCRPDQHLIKQLEETFNQSSWSSKVYALTIMIALLKQDQSSAYQDYYKSWYKMLMHLLQGKIASMRPNFKRLVNVAIAKLLVRIARVSDTANQFITHHLSALVQYMTKLDSTQVDGSFLALLTTLLQHYSSACGQYHKPLRRWIIQCMQHQHDLIWPLACQNLIALTKCGGSGNAGSKHIENWYQLCNELIATLQSDWHQLYKDIDQLKGEGMVLIPSNASISPIQWQPLPTDEPNRTYTLIHQVQVGCTCLTLLLQQEFAYPVSIPIATLIKIVSNIINVNHRNIQQDQHRNIETTLLLSCISKLHCHAIHLLSALIHSSRCHLLPYYSLITKILLKVLEITQQQDWPQDCRKPFLTLRKLTYQVLSELLLLVSTDTLQYTDEFIHHIMYDMKPNVYTTKLQASTTANNSSQSKVGQSKKKRKGRQYQYEDINSNFRNDNRINPFLNQEICTAALKLLQTMIICLGSSIDATLFQTITNFITQSLMQIQQGFTCNPTISSGNTIPVPYSSGACRLELYRSLLSCVQVSCCSKMPTILRYAIQILSHGKRDFDIEIIKFCYEALATCTMLIHTTRPTLPTTVPTNSSLTSGQDLFNKVNSLNHLNTVRDTLKDNKNLALSNQFITTVDELKVVKNLSDDNDDGNGIASNSNKFEIIKDSSTTEDQDNKHVMSFQASNAIQRREIAMQDQQNDDKGVVVPNVNVSETVTMNSVEKVAAMSSRQQEDSPNTLTNQIPTLKRDMDSIDEGAGVGKNFTSKDTEPVSKRVRFNINNQQTDTCDDLEQSEMQLTNTNETAKPEDSTDDDRVKAMLDSFVDSQPDSDDVDDNDGDA